jgi:hypothetical protein
VVTEARLGRIVQSGNSLSDPTVLSQLDVRIPYREVMRTRMRRERYLERGERASRVAPR